MYIVEINRPSAWRKVCEVETRAEAEVVADYCRRAAEQARVSESSDVVRPKDDSGIDLGAETGGEA